MSHICDNSPVSVNGAMCYIDDILVTVSTEEEHLQNLKEVLKCLQRHGVRMKRSKCTFMKDSVEYLGHDVDTEGVRATPQKISAIENAPMPTNVPQL